MIQDTRIQPLNDADETDGAYVLYWMQQAQRGSGNHALEVALREANRRELPLLVGFGLMDDYPEANARHYAFMLQGLRDVAGTLRERGIAFVVRRGAPDAVALALAEDAALVVCDRGYLRHQKRWRNEVAKKAGRRVLQVEADVVVPVEVASDKAETAARTLRPKLHRVWEDYLLDVGDGEVKVAGDSLKVKGDIDVSDPDAALGELKLDTGVAPVRRFTGGQNEARRRLTAFLRGGLDGYADGRNEPARGQSSYLSPYLHFGHVAPVEVACKVRRAKGGADDDRAAYLEELIVRRELSMNWVNYNDAYDRYEGLPGWARKTLAEHADDRRDPQYSLEQLEAADTHDPHWNAAMREMTRTGYMHNYMRMYWGKKILEWSPSPQEAHERALYLNNRYFLDGRDANSFTNVAWLFGQHDRPWRERAVFGQVRYMNDKGLERKFDMKAYAEAVERLVAEER